MLIALEGVTLLTHSQASGNLSEGKRVGCPKKCYNAFEYL